MKVRFLSLVLLLALCAGFPSSMTAGGLTVAIGSSPVLNAQVGQQYVYDVDAVANDSAAVLIYTLPRKPDGMTIDQSTGLIEWTPTASGSFRVKVKVRARIGDNDEAEAEQEYNLRVTSNAAGNISGTVQDSNGVGLRRIEVKVFGTSDNSGEDDHGRDLIYRTRTDSTGAYLIAGVDPGTYFIKADGEDMSGLEDQWFDGVHRFEDATPVVIAESTAFVANFVLRGGAFEDRRRFDLFGAVRDSSGNALTGALVVARRRSESADDDDIHSHVMSDGHGDDAVSVRTDSLGNYHLRLKSRTYILSAIAQGFKKQYWNHMPTKETATRLRLTQDTSGIDFDLASASLVLTGGTRFPSNSLEIVVQPNYPNPFNPATTINFTLPEAGMVRMVVFNQLGQEVATLINEQLDPGTHAATWDAGGVASGVYYYSVIFNGRQQMGRMLLLR